MFSTRFDMWLAVFDLLLYDFSGCVHTDLPISKNVFRNWYRKYTANFVATVLSEFIQEIGYAN